MTLSPEELDPNSDLRRKARANVATFPPLTGEQLAALSRLFAGTNVPSSAGGSTGRSGGSGSPATFAAPVAGVVGPRSSGSRRDGSGRPGAPTWAGRDSTSFPKS